MIVKRIGQGKPLVLFHGWGIHSGIWQSIIPELSQYFTLYLIDLPGFGQSEYVQLSLDEYLNCLANNLPGDAVVLGWSMGGIYASQLALHHPHKVSHLVNICTSPCFVADKAWPGLSESALNHFMKQLHSDYQQCLLDFLTLQLSGRSLHFIPELTPIVTHPTPNFPALKSGLYLLKTADLRHQLHQLTQACWYVFGRLDKIVPAETLDVMKSHYPQFHYTLYRHHAHMPFLSNQTEFITDLLAFIDEN